MKYKLERIPRKLVAVRLPLAIIEQMYDAARQNRMTIQEAFTAIVERGLVK